MRNLFGLVKVSQSTEIKFSHKASPSYKEQDPFSKLTTILWLQNQRKNFSLVLKQFVDKLWAVEVVLLFRDLQNWYQPILFLQVLGMLPQIILNLKDLNRVWTQQLVLWRIQIIIFPEQLSIGAKLLIQILWCLSHQLLEVEPNLIRKEMNTWPLKFLKILMHKLLLLLVWFLILELTRVIQQCLCQILFSQPLPL